MQDIPLFTTKNGRLILIGGGLVFVAIVVIIILAMTGVIGGGGGGTPEPETDHGTTVIDPISGEKITESNKEPEIKKDTILFIGFYQIQKLGISAKQYSKLINTITSYISKKYPDAKRLSYKKDSYKYTNKDMTQSSFRFAITDTEQYFTVNLDNKNSYSDIEIKIVKE